MKKSLLVIMLTSIVSITFNGCGSKNPKETSLNNSSSNSNSSGIVIDDGIAIAYAHMKGGTKLIKIDSSSIPENEDVEIIKITKNGFYPNYQIDKTDYDRKCGRHYENGVLKDWTTTNFCKSNYTSTSASQAGKNIVWNSLFVPIAVITNPINTASGKPLYDLNKTFNQETFFSVIKDNNLVKYQTVISEVGKYAEEKSSKHTELYKEVLSKYKDDMKLVSINYDINDKSGLANDINIKWDYKILPDTSAIKTYSYSKFIPNKDLIDNNNSSEYFKKIIDAQYENDIIEHKKYLSQGFKSYKLEGTKNYTMNYNDNISFYMVVNAPENIKYNAGEKMNVTIPVTVEYADLKNMIPTQFILDDSNFRINMKTNTNSVTAISSNKTKSFLTLKSLTGYYSNLLLNHSNVDRELAPEAESLASDSNYNLISAEMREKSNFKNMTKSKMQSTQINFGYAVKYKINNTNIEKSIYDTKNYSLYEIYKQYL